MAGQHVMALTIIDDTIRAFGLDDARPQTFHHYTSIEVALSILKDRNLWLCNAEYLNDADEIRGAQKLIVKRIEAVRQSSRMARQQTFLDGVLSTFEGQARTYEAFVFCMSEAINPLPPSPPTNQDVLSSWRAYGKNGRGVCLSYYSQHFAALSQKGGSGKRLSKVIYDGLIQERMVDHIIDEGWKHLNISNDPRAAMEATVATLIFIMPVMKNEGFKDEHEWRFIYLPEVEDHSASQRKFLARDGLIIPYYTLLDADADPANLPPPVEIMVGPSIHQELNLRSLDYIRGRAVMRISKIPYRA